LAWGDLLKGADTSSVKDELKDVVSITSNFGAFAAIKKDGTVTTWGHVVYGANSSSVKDELTDVVSITPTKKNFRSSQKGRNGYYVGR